MLLVVEHDRQIECSPRDSLPHPAKAPFRSPTYLAFVYIASRTEPALCLEMSRQTLKARREFQQVSSDIRQIGCIRQLSEFLGSLA